MWKEMKTVAYIFMKVNTAIANGNKSLLIWCFQ